MRRKTGKPVGTAREMPQGRGWGEIMQTTRRRILALLRERQKASVGELAVALEITPMAVRHHLNVLRGEEWVSVSHLERRDRPGRPRQIYQLSPAAEAGFPDGLSRLSGLLMAQLHASLPAAAWRGLVQRLAERLVSPAQGEEALSLEGRLRHSAHYLEGLGVELRWHTEWAGGWLICAGCPFDASGLWGEWACDLHQAMLMRLLGVGEGDLTRVGPSLGAEAPSRPCPEGCFYRLSPAG
ncbi:MAG: helix-turn-helix transcriptional regulator [Anaerolineae bacterium]